MYKLNQFNELDFSAKPRWALDESAVFLKNLITMKLIISFFNFEITNIE